MTDNRKYIWLTGGVIAGALGVVALGAALTPAFVMASIEKAVGDDEDGPRGHLMKKFKEADTDHDMRISAEEFNAAAGQRFTDADADADGNVTKEETIAFVMKKVEEMVDKKYSKLDSDGDGEVTKAEYDTWTGSRFGKMDRTGDGYLDREDMRKFREEHGHGPHGDGPAKGEPKPE
jgi:Ca2+-binding EF-hand superfamily protein